MADMRYGRHSYGDDRDQPRMSTFKSLRRLTVYLRPYKFAFAVAFVLMIAASFLRTLPPMVVRLCLNTSIRGESLSLGYFLNVGWVLLCLHLITSVIGYMHRVAAAEQGQGVIRDLRNRVFLHLQTLPLKFYDNQQTGELMSRIMNDIDRLEWGVVEAVLEIANSILTFGFMIMLMAKFISVELTLVALSVIPFMFFFTLLFNRKLHGLFHTRREKIGDLTTIVQENLSGIRVVKAFCREDYEQDRFEQETESYFSYGIRMNRTLALALNLMAALGAISGVIVLAYGGWLVLKDPKLEVGDLVAMLMYTGMLHAPIRTLIHSNYHMQRSGASAKRVFDLLDTKPEIVDAPDAVPMPSARGRVELQDVTFSYDGEAPILKQVSVDAHPGETIALVGRSGAGKTTIVNLIPRLYDVESGAVLVDGVDVRKIKYADLRRNISMVMQDVFLFNGSIRQNIAYGRLDATDEEITAAAQAAHVDEFVNELPDGYETEIGERGVRLSGGQRQRISVARAILADAPILLLDEPTSNVDTHSERLIQEALEKLMRDRTTVVVAHRLSTIINADKIILLERGEVQAVGNHDELLATSPLYAYLYRVQARGEHEE